MLDLQLKVDAVKRIRASVDAFFTKHPEINETEFLKLMRDVGANRLSLQDVAAIYVDRKRRKHG